MNPLEQKLLKTISAEHWKKIGVGQHHGICIPLFSIHSEKSCGIGEYLDLLGMIDWCQEVGMDVIQLLPINDTGLGTSPYSAISAFALNFLHLSLWALDGVEQIADYEEKISQMRYWNRTPRVKYHIIRELKLSFLRAYFEEHFDRISEQESYKTFVAQNNWLDTYALFRALKEKKLWMDWEKWEPEFKSPTPEQRTQLLMEHHAEIDFYKFLQFLCFEQMKQVKAHASSKGVLLKGDIPILISRDSADVWSKPHLFLMEYAAGAPPDMYTKKGQYWGFPVYDWDAMEKDDFSWWKQRLEIASHLYHLYRIDHVVGFFRFWAIPRAKQAIEGHFIPENESLWLFQGRRLMEMMVKAAPILPIGEDLGLVPQNVKEALYALGICGTKVMRWEHDSKGTYIPIDRYQPLTMTTLSTHDTDTLQLWWRHFPKEAKKYCEFKEWDYRPFLDNERHKEILHDSHHSSSLFHVNLLNEYLALFEDLTSINMSDERINIPGKILERNWTFRYRPTLEGIFAHQPLRALMKELELHT